MTISTSLIPLLWPWPSLKVSELLESYNLCNHSVEKWREVTLAYWMANYVREMTAKKSCKYGKYGLFEHLLFGDWGGGGGGSVVVLLLLLFFISYINWQGMFGYLCAKCPVVTVISLFHQTVRNLNVSHCDCGQTWKFRVATIYTEVYVFIFVLSMSCCLYVCVLRCRN